MPTLPIEKRDALGRRCSPTSLRLGQILRSLSRAASPGRIHLRAQRGWRSTASVMAGWVGHMAALLEPLAERIARSCARR